MKKLLAIPLIAFLSVPAFANGWTHEDEVNSERMEEGRSYDDSFLTDEEIRDQRMEDNRMEEQRMEDRREDAIDYNDRTRTNRARGALNTGSDASDY